MNIESRTDSAKGIRTHIIRSEINLSEIRNFLEALYLSAGFDPGVHALWDVRETVFPEVTPADIKDLADFARINWAEKHPRKTAVVISSDFHFGLSRMFEQFIGPSAHGKIRSFRDLQTAVDWIGAQDTAAAQPVAG